MPFKGAVYFVPLGTDKSAAKVQERKSSIGLVDLHIDRLWNLHNAALILDFLNAADMCHHPFSDAGDFLLIDFHIGVDVALGLHHGILAVTGAHKTRERDRIEVKRILIGV